MPIGRMFKPNVGFRSSYEVNMNVEPHNIAWIRLHAITGTFLQLDPLDRFAQGTMAASSAKQDATSATTACVCFMEC